jgi:hypothetical protein
MKTLDAVAAILFAASHLSAQTPPADKPADTKPTEVKPADKTTVTTPTEVKPADAKPTPAPAPKTPVKKVEVPKIPGFTITRGNGTFLGLEVVGGNFKLSFYNAKKKPMAPDVTRATARWPNPHGPHDFHTVLNLSGNALVGTKPALPPYTYNVFLTLLKGDGDEAKAVENYVVPFRI